MKLLATILFMVGSLSAFAQINFQAGYVIFNDGQRTECEIRNVDWDSNPTSFQYRVAGGEPKEGTLENTKEFGITGGATFVRFSGDIDRSSDIADRLSVQHNPEYKRETLFLRLLVQGKAILYEYIDTPLKRYFYAVDGGEPKQLIYKRYMQQATGPSGSYQTGYAATNAAYKQQIFNDMKCASITEKKLKQLDYKRSDLMKVFSEFNECTGTAVQSNEATERKTTTHISLRPGLFFNTFSVNDGSSKADFESKPAFRLGLEIEFVLPFNNGLWAATFEPAYQSYSSTYNTATIDYQAFDLNFNARRYLFINENGSMYLNFGLSYGFALGGDAGIKGISVLPLKISTGANWAAGLGYRKDQFSAELNYAFGRGLLGDYLLYTSSYGGPGLILGFRFK